MESKYIRLDGRKITFDTMKPRIDSTKFGSITVEDTVFQSDIQIGLDGVVRKRKKKLSKQVSGTSHVLSLAEAKHVYEKGAKRLIFGIGHFKKAKLSEEASEFFREKKCKVELLATPKAVRAWNEAEGNVIGLFHITC